METIVVTRTFEGDLHAMVAYARSLNARLHWPGAVLEFEQPDRMLNYTVGMRLKSATMVDIAIDETLSEVERSDSGEVVFSTVNRGLWPDGVMTCLAEYRFIPGEGGEPNVLRYSYSYPPPSSKLVKSKQLPSFNAAMDRVCHRYVRGLLTRGSTGLPTTGAPVPAESLTVATAPPAAAEPAATSNRAAARYHAPGMDTVVVTRQFGGDFDSMVEYTRSLKSRLNWPGAVLEHDHHGSLCYQVGMRLKAAVMTDVNVEERVGPVDRLEDGTTRFTSAHRVLWPDGLHADAIAEYLFLPGLDGAPHTLRFTYSFPPPSTKVVRTRELPAFHDAMERVAIRYLDQLTDSSTPAGRS